MLVLAVFVVFFHWALGGLACGWDTSYCAVSQDKDTAYAGTLESNEDGVLANTEFTVAFESRLDAPRVGGFSTDETGAYCVLWAREAVSPQAYVGDTFVARLEIPEDAAEIQPSECQTSDASIPWNRTDELRDTNEFRAPFVPGAAAIVVLLIGVFRPRRALFLVGSLLTAVTFAAVAVLWFF